MKVFKFGGASVKDAVGVKNLVKVLQHEGFDNTLIVISAMGKMTNAFEEIIDAYYNKKDDLSQKIDFVRTYHFSIISDLFLQNNHTVIIEIEQFFGQLSGFLITNKNRDYNFIYDQIIGFGELISTKIVSAYLNEVNIVNSWIDVREYIKTDATYRDAYVNWELTKQKITTLNTSKLYITQGFLGSNENSKTTSLGREGSDYSAAIFAYCLNAASLSIWKDVDGVLNADPRFFENAIITANFLWRSNRDGFLWRFSNSSKNFKTTRK